MIPHDIWRQRKVHKATRSYGCQWCGTKLASPQSFYRHRDTQHAAKKR